MLTPFPSRLRGLPSSVLHTLAFAAVLLAVCFGNRQARAQFTGPALPSTTLNNRVTNPTTDPGLLYPAATDFLLSSGDLISVKLFGPGDYSATVRLGTEGRVQLPLIGVLSLQGTTVFDAETLIAQKLVAAGMFRNPEILIQVIESPSSTISIIGDIHGTFPIVGQRRLLEVIAQAGGLPQTASHIITINRPGAKEPIVVDVGTDPAHSASANIPVFPGDLIVVPRVGGIYVLGGFKTEGFVPIVGNSPLTLLQVTALSGGPNKVAKYDDMRIIRTTGVTRTFVKLNIKRVMNGQDPDPVLQADDILYIPDSTIKSIVQDGTLNLFFSAASFLLNIYTLTRVN